MPIADGGGLGSSADWLVPRAKVDVCIPLRDCFASLRDQRYLVPRLQAHCLAKSAESLFSPPQLLRLREELVSFLRSAAVPGSLRVSLTSQICLTAGAAFAS